MTLSSYLSPYKYLSSTLPLDTILDPTHFPSVFTILSHTHALYLSLYLPPISTTSFFLLASSDM